MRYWAALESSLFLSYLFLWVPISFAIWQKAKKEPAAGKMVRFLFVIHPVQLLMIFGAQTQRMRHTRTLEKKYMSDLSDYEIDNFDELFQQLQQQKQGQAPSPLLASVPMEQRR